MPAKGQLPRDLAQSRRGGVACGDDPLLWLERPGDGQIRIVVGDSALELRVVVGGLLVEDVGDVAEHAKAMGEAGRGVQRTQALIIELHGLPLRVRGRAAAQIDGDVEYPPARAADQLAQAGPYLEVQAPHDPARGARV